MNDTPLQPGLRQLTRMCQAIRLLLLAFLLVQIAFFIVSWLVPMPLMLGSLHVQLDPDGMATGSVNQLAPLQRMLGMAVGLPGLAMLTYAISRLGRTLTHFENGKIFAIETIAYLRAAAGATFMSVALFNLEKPLRGVVFNLTGGGKNYPVAIDVTSNELLLILVCSLFYLIAGVMHEGRRLSEENEGFI